MNNNPILNSPYDEPKLHYNTNEKGELDYEDIREGRRIFVPDVSAMPTKQGPQKGHLEVNDMAEDYGTHLVNLIRKEEKKLGYGEIIIIQIQLVLLKNY